MSSTPRISKARALIRKARAWAASHGNAARARHLRDAQADLAAAQNATKPKPKPVLPVWPAIAAARDQSQNGPQFGQGECLQRVRGCYGIPSHYPSAAAAWVGSDAKHHETNPHAIPRGYPVFWTGGAKGFGHVAISAGDGNCWSTDIDRAGFFDYTPISVIGERWGLSLVGWTTDLNGVPIDPNHTGA